MSFIVAFTLFLLVYAVLRVRVLYFHLQDVNYSDADHDEDENRDPLKRLLRLYLLVQMVDSLIELVHRCVEMLLTDRNRLFSTVVGHV